MKKKEPSIEAIKKYYDNQHTKHQQKWLSRPNPRIQAVVDFAQNQIIKHKPATLLSLGCGIGIITNQLAELVPYITAVDLSETNIKTAKEHNNHRNNIRYMIGDFTRMSLGASFNMVTMFDVVEHIRPSDRKAFLLNARLHCNGIALVSIPNPVVTIHNKKIQPEALQIVDEPVYDKDFDMFTIQQRVPAGKYIYYILTP